MSHYSYQLYSSRNFGPLDATLAMLADLGYQGVEGYDALYGEAGASASLADALGNHGLAMNSGHVGLSLVEGDAEGLLDRARRLGMTQLFVPYLGDDERPADAAGWAALGAHLSKIGAPLVEAGLTLGWHNHDFEFRPLPDGTFPIDALFEGGPELRFEFDVAWAVKAGQDPLHWIEKLGDRIVASHVKDIAAPGTALDEDGWANVGRGTMDWPVLIAALKAQGCGRFIVEHDNPSDDARFAQSSIDFLTAL